MKVGKMSIKIDYKITIMIMPHKVLVCVMCNSLIYLNFVVLCYSNNNINKNNNNVNSNFPRLR